MKEEERIRMSTERIERKSMGEVVGKNRDHLDGERERESLERWKAENIGAVDDMVSRELMKLDNLEEVIVRDYENSKRTLKPMEYAALMARGLSMDEIDECFASRPMSGDARYLDTLLRISMNKMRLIGVVGRVDKRKQSVVQYNFNGMSDEEIKGIVDKLQDVKYGEGD